MLKRGVGGDKLRYLQFYSDDDRITGVQEWEEKPQDRFWLQDSLYNTP